MKMWMYRLIPQRMNYTLANQDGDRKDKSISDTSPTIGSMSHTLIASTFITDFNFKAILKRLFQQLTNIKLLNQSSSSQNTTQPSSLG